MDGENNGSKPYEQMDDLGGNTPIFGSTPSCRSPFQPFKWVTGNQSRKRVKKSQRAASCISTGKNTALLDGDYKQIIYIYIYM